MSIIRLSAKHRITIPRAIREKLQIEPGQALSVSEKDGVVMLTPIPRDPVAFLCGIFRGGPSATEELLEDRRRELGDEEGRAW